MRLDGVVVALKDMRFYGVQAIEKDVEFGAELQAILADGTRVSGFLRDGPVKQIGQGVRQHGLGVGELWLKRSIYIRYIH